MGECNGDCLWPCVCNDGFKDVQLDGNFGDDGGDT